MATVANAPVGYRPDLFIHGRDNEFIALIEVKNPHLFSGSIALEIYRDITERITVYAPYFLMLSQHLGFLWQRKEVKDQHLVPAAEFSMQSIMERYASNLAPGERLRGRELDYVAYQWLSRLTEGTIDSLAEPEGLLAQTGFLSAIQGGSIVFETGIPDVRWPSLLP